MQLNLILENKSNIYSSAQLFNLATVPNIENIGKYFNVNIFDFALVTSQPVYDFRLLVNVNGSLEDLPFFNQATIDQSFIGFVNSFNSIIGGIYGLGITMFNYDDINYITYMSNDSPIINNVINIYSTIATIPFQTYSFTYEQAIEVTPAIETAPYQLILDSQISQRYLIDELYIASTSAAQITESIRVQYKDADGSRQVSNVTPVIDPYQIETCQIVRLSNPIVLDGETQIGVEIPPFARTNFYLSGKTLSSSSMIGDYINGMKVLRAIPTKDNPIVKPEQEEIILVFDENKSAR